MATTKKYGYSARATSIRTEKALIAPVWVIACTIVFLMVRRQAPNGFRVRLVS
jgi:hypothetical protein